MIFYFILIVSLPGDVAGETRSVVNAGNRFGVELYSRIYEVEGNLFFSPMSVHTALSMTLAGASNQTAIQMAEVLGFERIGQDIHSDFATLLEDLNTPRMINDIVRVESKYKKKKKPSYQLVIANALWGQKDYQWNPDFLNLTVKNYGAGLHEVDFVNQKGIACKKINTWIEKITKDRIKDMIRPSGITPMTRLILVNAIYLKAEWLSKFPDRRTKESPFHITKTDRMITKMMTTHVKGYLKYMETDTFQALEMPYRGGELSMTVFLPKKIDGLRDFEINLTPESLSSWLEALKIEEVLVYFPKFEFETGFGLSGILKAMGMTDAFSSSLADFSGITLKEKIYISDVFHKTFVAVDEEGTEAAAATAIRAKGARKPEKRPQPKIFKADHPFFFIIRHNTSGAILFIGRVVKPEVK